MADDRHHRVEVMGTVVTLDLFVNADLDADDEARLVAAASARLREDDATFSTWIPASPVSRLRRGELTLDECPPRVGEVLEIARELRAMTNGWFDPWAMPGGVDPTGLVKGWSAQRALAALEHPALEAAMVNAAGDIATRGTLDGEPLLVGIANPRDHARLIAVVALRGALATSGDDQRPGQLIDPHDGRARVRFLSASVAGPSLAVADGLATALCVGGAEVLEMIAATRDYSALVVEQDGTARMTSGFPLAR